MATLFSAIIAFCYGSRIAVVSAVAAASTGCPVQFFDDLLACVPEHLFD